MHSELLHNQWFGKALGFTSAFVLAPSSHTLLAVFIIAGILLGHCFDWWAAKQVPPTENVPKSAKSDSSSSPLGPQHHFLFAALGHVAKQSGNVKPAHIASAEAIMRSMQLSTQQREQAIAVFSAGKSSAFKFTKLTTQFRPDDALRKYILHAMCHVVAISPQDKALAATVKLASYLDISPSQVATAFGEALENRQTSHTKHEQPSKPQPKPKSNPDEGPYKVLGIPTNSSASDAKKAYRKLISKAHPDKLPPNASEETILAATQRMVELREALEAIQQKR